MGGEKVYEVGSYALRPRGLLDPVQYHVRLTPRQGGLKTALWAHQELNPWRYPVRHYRSEDWDADEGVAMVAAEFATDDRYIPSDRALELHDGMDLEQFDD